MWKQDPSQGLSLSAPHCILRSQKWVPNLQQLFTLLISRPANGTDLHLTLYLALSLMIVNGWLGLAWICSVKLIPLNQGLAIYGQ